MKRITTNLSFLILVLTLFNQTVSAQKCLRNIFEREGTVYSGGPANMNFYATSKKIEIKFRKTDGTANAHLNITYKRCVTCETISEQIAFDYNEANTTKSVVIDDIKGHRINMQLVNNSSITRSISYDIDVKGRSNILLHCKKDTPHLNSIGSGLLGIGDLTDIFYTVPSCSGKVKVYARGTSGKAEASIKIYEENGKNTNGKTIWRLIETGIFSAYTNIVFDKDFDSDKMLKIQLEQTSAATWNIFYNLSVTAIKDAPPTAKKR